MTVRTDLPVLEHAVPPLPDLPDQLRLRSAVDFKTMSSRVWKLEKKTLFGLSTVFDTESHPERPESCPTGQYSSRTAETCCGVSPNSS